MNQQAVSPINKLTSTLGCLLLAGVLSVTLVACGAGSTSTTNNQQIVAGQQTAADSSWQVLSWLPQVLVGQAPSVNKSVHNDTSVLFSRYATGGNSDVLELASDLADIPRRARQPLIVLQTLAQDSTCLINKLKSRVAVPAAIAQTWEVAEDQLSGHIVLAGQSWIEQLAQSGCSVQDYSEAQAKGTWDLSWSHGQLTLQINQLDLPQWHWEKISIQVSAAGHSPVIEMSGAFKGQSFSVNFVKAGDWTVQQGSELCTGSEASNDCSQFFQP